MKKHLLQHIIIVLFLFLLSSVTQAVDIKQEKPRLLIVPLKAKKGIDQDEATLLTDVLSVEIYRSGMFTILNRDDMKAVLTEKEFEIAIGCDDNVCLLENVSKLAVNKLIAGNIGKLGEKYIISLRLINADGHNEVMEKESCNCKIEVLDKAIERLSYKLLKYLGAEVTTYGSIRVESEPTMAKIKVDNTPLGTTPDVIRYMELGPHKVEVVKDGYKRWSRKVNLESGEEEVLIAILQKKSDSITPAKKPVPTDKYLDSSSIYSANNSKIFHRYNCPELNTEDLIEFNSSQAALNAGGIPCRRCNPSPPAHAGVNSTQQIRRATTPFFQDRFVRVTLQSINKSKDKKRVNLVLLMENITNNDIWLGFQTKNASLLGNDGVEWSVIRVSGIEAVYGSNSGKKHYSVFNPGTINTINITFHTSRADESDETIFSFSCNMFRFVKNPTRFSIGLTDMRITQ
jgi:hypothetical protein